MSTHLSVDQVRINRAIKVTDTMVRATQTIKELKTALAYLHASCQHIPVASAFGEGRKVTDIRKAGDFLDAVAKAGELLESFKESA